MNALRSLAPYASAALLPLVICSAAAAARVDIVVGPEAPPVERLAARELADQFERLLKVETTTEDRLPNRSTHLVLIGSSRTNPAVKEILGDRAPKLSDQGIMLRSFERNGARGLVVGGGSPAATLWAVYELGHRLGIRYLLGEDIFPATPVALLLDGFDEVLEPTLRLREWRTLGAFAAGSESWGLADQRRLIGQLAKLKFNRLTLELHAWQPFVDYHFQGTKKQTAGLFLGRRYRVDGETPGRAAFAGAAFFENPDFAGRDGYDPMVAAGVELVRALIDAAHARGMSAGISISPLEFPPEFASHLPGAEPAQHGKKLAITPGGKQGPEDRPLVELVKTKIRAYLKTYPDVDAVCLSLSAMPQWNQYEPSARSAGGNRAALKFVRSLVKDESLLRRPDGRQVELEIAGIDPGLLPELDRIVPPGAAVVHFVGRSPRRIVEQKSDLTQLPAAVKSRSRMSLTLADEKLGVLSQSPARRIGELLAEIRRLGWDGFQASASVLGELDASVYYLSRAAYDGEATPRSAHDELFEAIGGSRSAADRLWRGLGHIEAAAELIDRHDAEFAYPAEGMLIKHYRPEPVPEWWKELSSEYEQASIELYRSHGAVDARARKLVFYYAKRSEYVLEYLAAVQAVREAALAHKAGDADKQLEQLETAVEGIYNAIDTLGDVARDPSDRGLIAILANDAYRPLVAEAERIAESSESER